MSYVKCHACGESNDTAFESCQYCGATLVAEDPQAMARRAQPPEEKKAPIPGQRPEPSEQQSNLIVAGAVAGVIVVLVVVGWIGNAIVRGVRAVGEHEDVQKLERDVNDAWKKVPKRSDR